MARRARAFGLQIHYHNRRRLDSRLEEQLDATYWDSLDQMLARMDIVSVNCPHTPATFHLLSARRLKRSVPSWAGRRVGDFGCGYQATFANLLGLAPEKVRAR